jgi:hypothetical protein
MRGRHSVIDMTPATFTPRCETARNTKMKFPNEITKDNPRLGVDRVTTETLRPAEKEFINDYNRRGSGNAYNIYEE